MLITMMIHLLLIRYVFLENRDKLSSRSINQVILQYDDFDACEIPGDAPPIKNNILRSLIRFRCVFLTDSIHHGALETFDPSCARPQLLV